MAQQRGTSQQHYEGSERTVALERDLIHLDTRLNALSVTVGSAHNRLHALSERIKRAEWQLDQTTSSLANLEKHTSGMAERMPDIEGTVKLLRWLVEAIKYIIGMAILAGAIAGGQSVEALRAIFG